MVLYSYYWARLSTGGAALRLTPKLEAAIAGLWVDGAIWGFDRRLGLTLGSNAYSEVRRAGCDPGGVIHAESEEE